MRTGWISLLEDGSYSLWPFLSNGFKVPLLAGLSSTILQWLLLALPFPPKKWETFLERFAQSKISGCRYFLDAVQNIWSLMVLWTRIFVCLLLPSAFCLQRQYCSIQSQPSGLHERVPFPPHLRDPGEDEGVLHQLLLTLTPLEKAGKLQLTRPLA